MAYDNLKALWFLINDKNNNKICKTNQMKKYLIFKKWYKQVDKHGLKFLVVLFIVPNFRVMTDL